MFVDFIKSLINLFCGPPSSNESPGYPQQQQSGYPPQQQPGYPQQPQQGYPVQHPQRPETHQEQNQHQINQGDDHYTSLRARANEEGNSMARAFEESHQAYSRGDGALAKQLSNQGKDHQRRMEQLNKEASDWIFAENNKNRKPGEVDLHGLYVKEAVARTDQALQSAKARGDTQLNLIVGKGLHSKGGIAKVKPAIEELMQRHRVNAVLDPNNAGVLIVQINSNMGEHSVGPDEISRCLERNDESCIIM